MSDVTSNWRTFFGPQFVRIRGMPFLMVTVTESSCRLDFRPRRPLTTDLVAKMAMFRIHRPRDGFSRR